MGQPQPGRQVRPQRGDQDVAVTPVIGAILILAITVLGIAGVLMWGAPMIDRIQSQNAQVAIVGEFEDLRVASRELSVPDHSRFPTVVLSRGELTIERGSRIMVTAILESDCQLHVTGWTDTAVNVEQTNCGDSTAPAPVLTTYLVAGDTLVPTAFSGTDQTTDWLWRVTDTSCPGTDHICGEAWLHSGDQVTWSMEGSDQERSVHLDSGAIYSETGGTLFLEKEPIIADTIFGNTGSQPYYGLWLRSLDAASYSSISGSGSHQVYFSLIGNYLRDDASVYRVRLDISGPLSEAWCNALLARNDRLPDTNADGVPDSSYHSQAADCADIETGLGEVRSVCYSQVVSTSDACTLAPTAFTFRFLHARIYTSLAV